MRQRLDAAVSTARAWLDDQDKLRRLVFTRLEQAVRERRFDTVRSMMQQADKLARNGHSITAEEQGILKAANQLQRSRRPGAVAAAERRRQPAAQPGRGPNRKVAERARRAAQDGVVRELTRLRRDGKRMSANDIDTAVNELAKKAAAAGDKLTARQRRDIESWMSKTSKRRQRSSGSGQQASPGSADGTS